MYWFFKGSKSSSFIFLFFNGKERYVNHHNTGCCVQGQLLDRRQPLGSPRCAETRPPPARRHDSGIIGKTSPLIQDEPVSPVFALHLNAAENNGKSVSRTLEPRLQGTPSLSTTTPQLLHWPSSFI
ncbi:hypothetical protein Hanom_Chr01g00002301 [Helianthus anomalus]